MIDTITVTLSRVEATMWAARMKKVRDEVANWKDPIKRDVMLVHLDSLLSKLNQSKFDDGDVDGA